MFEILETQKILASGAHLTLLPENSGLLSQLISARNTITPQAR